MKRNLIIGIVVLVVVAGGAAAVLLTPHGARAPVTSTTASTTLPATGQYAEHAQYYDIVANYATSTPLPGAAHTAAAAAMQRFVASTIAQFKKDGNFANLTSADAHTMGLDTGRKESLAIVYLIASSPHTVSYIFTTTADTLGAHPNMYFHTFTFDTTTGQQLGIGDLFTSGSDYLGALSDIARAKLPAVIGEGADPQTIAGGTTPDAKNFSNFFLDNHNLDILFDPYAVASYAAGPQTLAIPTTELANVLKPEYQ